MISSGPHSKTVMGSRAGTIISTIVGKNKLMCIRHQTLMQVLWIVAQSIFSLLLPIYIF